MKVFKFHQFIKLERGQVNTAIIDFLRKSVFHIDNNTLDLFENKKYEKIKDFIQLANKQELLLEVDQDKWIPSINFDNENQKDNLYSFDLIIEERVDLDIIKEKFSYCEIPRIIIYRKRNGENEKMITKNIIRKRKDFSSCIKMCTVNGCFNNHISEDYYRFNMRYNSCWGKKITVTNDYEIKPCIFSNIVISRIDEDSIDDIIKKIKRYWFLTKNKITKCKDCEFKYICFDCREIARKSKNDLYAENPYCSYDPFKGIWAI
ncbi:MAG: hypothetical protein GF317_15080 [Candidatus Lokiarchaeota archaeon]|nr:hypothetical protein [Candidatus Lokiarchaeota archaeon]